MKILLTGATGYIGQRLLPVLVDAGHEVVCCVRDARRFSVPSTLKNKISVIEVDFLKPKTLSAIPKDLDAAYYLIHSMSAGKDFQKWERECAQNFCSALHNTAVKQVIYLSGMVNAEELSTHLSSRKQVENILSQCSFALTTLRAGIVIGSGSGSFEIIRDLVEKLPFMIAPKWLNTKCQPIGIKDALAFLSKSLGVVDIYNRSYDIAGPDVLTYKEMLLGYAKARKLRRRIWTVPVMSPRISSYWLYFITSTSFHLASSLVNSMKVEVVARNHDLQEILDIQPLTYAECLERTQQKVKANHVVSSWKDSISSGVFNGRISDFLEVPEFGCFKDHRERAMPDKAEAIGRIWRIGGKTGWYYATWLWKIRGIMDKMVGGVGLRRGRTHVDHLEPGDALDFWRVLYANKAEGRLLLLAEMKLPGEAWLEWRVEGEILHQTATFRPKGIWGRIYWYAVWPFHGFIFRNMLARLAG